MRKSTYKDSHYEEAAAALVHDFGFKGNEPMSVITGRHIWRAMSKRNSRQFLKVLRDNGFPFKLVSVGNKTHMLVLGRDRVIIAEHIIAMRKCKEIDATTRNDYIRRLVAGEFPNKDDDYEVGLELEALLQA